MKRILIAAVVSACLPVAAYAGTCGSPTPISSFSTVAGNTCGGETGINLGGTVFYHPTTVYSFVAEDPEGFITLSGANFEMAIAESCTSAPLPQGVGAPGLPINLDGNTFTNGQTYLLLVTTDTGIPVGSDPLCGDFSVETDKLPVSLQNVTVD